MSLWDKSKVEKVKRTAEMDRKEADPEYKKRLSETRELASQIEVVIPYRPSDGINPKMVEYIIQWVNMGIAWTAFRDCFGGFIDVLRANMCRTFLRESRRKFLVMIDNDVVPFRPESVLQLCSNNLPVVSGIACAFNPGTGIFACIGVKDKTGVARFPTIMDTKVLPGYGIREVESCGAGILAIRRDVLESMRDEPFLMTQEMRLEAASIGTFRKTEDIHFADQVHKAGHKLYADFSVHCFHDKTLPLHWSPENCDPELDPEDWDVTSAALAVERK